MLSPVLITGIIHFFFMCTFIFPCPSLREEAVALVCTSALPPKAIFSISKWFIPGRVPKAEQSFVPQLAHQIAQQQQPGSPHPCPRMATCSPGPPAPGSWACRAEGSWPCSSCLWDWGSRDPTARRGSGDPLILLTPPSGSAGSQPGENHTWSFQTEAFSRWRCPCR